MNDRPILLSAPICVNCRHSRSFPDKLTMCQRWGEEIDVVTGRTVPKRLRSAWEERLKPRWFSEFRNCGPAGRYFEPLPPQSEDGQ